MPFVIFQHMLTYGRQGKILIILTAPHRKHFQDTFDQKDFAASNTKQAATNHKRTKLKRTRIF